MALFLTEQEVAELTGKQRHGAQVRALARMGIQCRVRPDGRPIVSRAAFEQAMGTNTGSQAEPDFGALHG
jgi:hypothetical protein